MKIYYLKTDSRATLLEALGEWWDSEYGNFRGPHPGDALVEIKVLSKPTGRKIQVDQTEVDETVVTEGYHADLMLHGELPERLEKLCIPEPVHKKHLFAGFK